jgi:hypothetical protein
MTKLIDLGAAAALIPDGATLSLGGVHHPTPPDGSGI